MIADSPQAVSPGFEPEPVPSERLFFALLPDAAARAQLVAMARQLRQAHGLKGRGVAAARLHVTLNFLGDHIGMPQALVDAAIAAAASIRIAAFDVAFDTAQSFPRARKAPLVLVGREQGSDMTDAGMDDAAWELHRQLGDALQAHQPPRASHAFTPHVTLLYDDVLLAPTPVEPVRWTATAFVLVHSLIGKGRHTVLGRWPLQTTSDPSTH